jgi:hypothetical protein
LSIDGYLRSWDTRTLRERKVYLGLPKQVLPRVSALAIAPDGGRFVSSEPNGDLVWWHTASAERLGTSEKAHELRKPAELAKLAREQGWPNERIQEIEEDVLYRDGACLERRRQAGGLDGR